MAIPETYVNNVGNLTKALEAIQTAGVPERVTFEFLKTLGFKSSNDRPIITVLKGIGFLDQNGAPTATYRAYRDPANGPRILAKALRAAYSDLFLANTNAQNLPIEKVKGIIATKVSKSNSTIKLIATTFKTLAKAADFSESESAEIEPLPEPVDPSLGQTKAVEPPPTLSAQVTGGPSLHYNIQIHLPTTTDISVYNAIFKSLKEHLL